MIPDTVDTTGCDIVVEEGEDCTEMTIFSTEAVKFFNQQNFYNGPTELLQAKDKILLDIDILQFLGEVVPQTWVCGVMLDDGTLGYVRPNTTH